MLGSRQTLGMASDDVVVLNEFGLTARSRTSRSGGVKTRYTVEIKAEPLVHNLDARALGKGPAEAIAKFLRDSIGGIGAAASPATVRARASAARNAGKSWASKRYAGGRIGAMAANASDRLFNDSGRLIKSIVARATRAGTYVINVAANRLDPETLDNGGAAALGRIFMQLRQYVPQLGDAAALADAIPVRRAVMEARAAMIKKLDAAFTRSALEIAKQVLELASQAGELGEAIAG